MCEKVMGLCGNAGYGISLLESQFEKIGQMELL
jgi:hypothetical protein